MTIGISVDDYRQLVPPLLADVADMNAQLHRRHTTVVVVFEGQDAADKLDMTVAAPDNSKSYFDRLPAEGGVVMFDRGWYSDACIQWVAGDGSLDAYHGTIEQCVATEARFVEAGVVLRKYWFSVSEEEQERRLQRRLSHPQRSIPDTPTDTEIRHRWVEYFKALEEAVIRTDTADSPWWVVDADSKPRARVNCIAHLLGSVPWRDRPLSEVGASREDELFHHVPDVVDVLARRPVDVDQRAWS